MKTSKKLVFFGTENFSLPSLRALIAANYNIAAVVTKPDAPAGRGRQMASPSVKKMAEGGGIKVLQPEKLREVTEDLNSTGATHGVLVAYGKILPQAVIDMFPGGIINVHPSLLPKYRGPSPIESAILNGDTKTGVSLMKLTAEMDAGPVFAQKEVAISPDTDRLRLTSELSELGAKYLLSKLPGILSGQTPPLPQDDSKATYTKLLRKSDGLIDWRGETAEQIERKVRAYLGFPKTTAKIHGHTVIVSKGRVVNSASEGSLVLPAKDGFFEVLVLIAPSGRTMSGADFSRGYKSQAAGA
jgi:methionyl-tRNA formyltransferase